MKIHQGSDFHLEFGRDNLYLPGGAKVLILNGDIFVPYHVKRAQEGRLKFNKVTKRYRKFFEECSQKYEHVIFVLGNHEHYYFRFQKTVGFIKGWFKQLGLENIHVLDNEAITIDGIKFFGATLWTNMRASHPEVMWDVKRNMSDCSLIQYHDETISMYGISPVFMTPQDMVKEHEYSMQRMIEELSTEEPAIVVTHHTPSYQSIPPWHNLDNLSYAYSTDLDDFIINSENLLMWFHGHTHTPFKYMIGNTAIVCNPRGYFGQDTKKVIRNYKISEIEIEIEDLNGQA